MCGKMSFYKRTTKKKIANTKIVKTKIKPSENEVLLNSARFRGKLWADVASLKAAIQIATDVGPNGLNLNLEFDNCPYGHVVALWVNATNCSSVDVDRSITSSLLNVLYSNGIFTSRMFNFALSECAMHGTTIQMELLLALPLPRIWLFDCEIGDRLAVMEAIHRDKWESVTCRLIERASNDYLNIGIVTGHEATELISLLQSAVEKSRVAVVSSLLCQLPYVDFDFCHIEHAVAQPVRLYLPTDETPDAHATKELVATGELITNTYYQKLKPLLFMSLSYLLIPPLTEIVSAYSARMPLSNTRLVFSSKTL